MNWQEICEHPSLQNIPFKIELNEYGKIVADCTGFTGTLRKKAPTAFHIEKEISLADCASAWQEIWSVKPAFSENLRPGS